MLDRSENTVNGEKGDGQDEDEQRRAAAQTISDPGQGDGGVLEALGNPVMAVRGTKWLTGPDAGAMCEVTDTPAEDSWSGAQWETGKWLESWSHKCMSGRLVHNCWQTQSLLFVITH